jgi:hypothetical protein
VEQAAAAMAITMGGNTFTPAELESSGASHDPDVNDCVWTCAGLIDGGATFNHRFLTDPGTDQPRAATQATLPKGAKVYYPSGGRGKRRKLDNGVRRR